MTYQGLDAVVLVSGCAIDALKTYEQHHWGSIEGGGLKGTIRCGLLEDACMRARIFIFLEDKKRERKNERKKIFLMSS